MGGGSWTRAFDTFNMFGMDKTSAPMTLPGSSSTSAPEAAAQQTDAITNANAKAISDAQTSVDNAAGQAQASVTDKKRAISRSRSVYTSPLGLASQAQTSRKTLLGQ
jgi:hypothetical protein